MVDISAIGSALASLNAAKTIAQAMIGLRDAQAFQAKAIEFQSKILDAQSSVFAANEERTALIERVRQLEKQMTDLEAWDAEKQKYELKHLPPGAFAYALKSESGVGEPPHWLCAACYQCHKKSILQDQGERGREHRWSCPECKVDIMVSYTVNPNRPHSATPRRPSAPVNPARACPKCGTEMAVAGESPHPIFGEMGLKIHSMQCSSCGAKVERDFQPGKGYT